MPLRKIFLVRSREFREGLRQELPVWEADGIVTPGAARALLARDALRADDYGGLSFGPGARPILKGEAKLEIVRLYLSASCVRK